MDIFVFDSITVSDVPSIGRCDHLLLETSFDLLQEDGYFLCLDQIPTADVYEEIIILEDVVLSVEISLSIYEVISITEDTTPTFSTSFGGPLENISISESIELELSIEVTPYEDISIVDEIVWLIERDINVNDSVSITEDVVWLFALEVSVNETIAISESVTYQLEQDLNLSEVILITEEVSYLLEFFLSKSEDVSIGEYVEISHFLITGLLSNSVTITESTSLALEMKRVEDDNIAITEEVLASNSIDLVVYDVVTLSEGITREKDLFISLVAETISITESLTVVGEVTPADEIVITESVQTEVITSLSVNDNISISEWVNPNLIHFADTLYEALSVSENVTTETIRFSPEIYKYQPKGVSLKVVPRGRIGEKRNYGVGSRVASFGGRGDAKYGD